MTSSHDDAVPRENREYINYCIRRLFDDKKYYIGKVATSIEPRLTNKNVLVRTVAYEDGDLDELDEDQLRLWRYTNDDDEINNQKDNATMKDDSDVAKQQCQDSVMLFWQTVKPCVIIIIG